MAMQSRAMICTIKCGGDIVGHVHKTSDTMMFRSQMEAVITQTTCAPVHVPGSNLERCAV